MRKLIKTLILVVYFGNLPSYSFPYKLTNICSNEFEQFGNLFQLHALPIDWDRGKIGHLSKPNWGQDRFNHIPFELLSFVPEIIVESDSVTNIRALFQLPPKDNLLFFIIATDFKYDRYGTGTPLTNILKIYLLVYNKYGEMKFQTKIAGYGVDKWDQLLTFNSDYKFETRYYEFLGGTMRHPTRNHLIGKMRYTKTTCEILANGIVNCTSETINGFFDTPNTGEYELIKIFEGK